MFFYILFPTSQKNAVMRKDKNNVKVIEKTDQFLT